MGVFFWYMCAELTEFLLSSPMTDSEKFCQSHKSK